MQSLHAQYLRCNFLFKTVIRNYDCVKVGMKNTMLWGAGGGVLVLVHGLYSICLLIVILKCVIFFIFLLNDFEKKLSDASCTILRILKFLFERSNAMV